MKRVTAIWAATIALLAMSGALQAHHSLGMFDTDNPLWVKGTFVRFERINPHAIIVMEEQRAGEQRHRWSVAGPSVPQLDRMGIERDFLKVGDVIEFCGFALKEGVSSQRTLPEPDGVPLQVLNGHVLAMPDGKKRFWSDYGQLHKCVSEEERASLLR